MGEQIHPWGSYIWKFEYDFDIINLKSQIDNIFSHWAVLEQSSLLESGNALSTAPVGVYDTILQPHNWKELQSYNDWLHEKIAFVWDKFEYKSQYSEIAKSWINIHKFGGSTLEHFHNKTDLVISAYLSCPAGSGNIEFRDPLEYHKLGTSIDIDNTNWREVPTKTNDILFFPGWLSHRTQKNNTNKDRIVLTYNISAVNGNPKL